MRRGFTRTFILRGGRAASTQPLNAGSPPTDPITTAAAIVCLACGINCLVPSKDSLVLPGIGITAGNAAREQYRQTRLKRTAKWREWFQARPQGLRDEAQEFLYRNAEENAAVEKWVRSWRYQYGEKKGRVPLTDKAALVGFESAESLKERDAAIIAGAAERGVTLAEGVAVHPQLIHAAEGLLPWSPIASDSPAPYAGGRKEDIATVDRNELISRGTPPPHIQRRDFFVVPKASRA